jgi:ribosomal protein L37AE/L43A
LIRLLPNRLLMTKLLLICTLLTPDTIRWQLGFPRLSGLAEAADGNGGRVAASGTGAERGRVPERFGAEEACRKALFAMRRPEGLTCPACGARGLRELTTRELFQCGRCKRQVRLTAGTVFQDTELPLTTWFAAIYHLTQSKGGVSSVELGRRLGAEQGTAWLTRHKLMRATAGREAAKPKLSGRVEMDDTYLGGARPGGKRGRGAAGKTPVVAAVETTPERRPRRMRLTVVKGFREREVERVARRDLAPGSTVVKRRPVLLARRGGGRL